MGVIITVNGADTDSDEYKSALQLKKIMQRDIPDSVMGEVVIYANATLFGMEVKDVDVLVMGTFHNYSVSTEFTVLEKDEDGEYVSKRIKDKVNINNIFSVIEVKTHDISGVWREGTDIYVNYKNKPKSVTEQSNKQKVSAFNFFTNSMGFSPFVTNLIWFTQIEEADIRKLLTNNGKVMESNVLGADYGFKDYINHILAQRNPRKYRGNYNYTSFDVEYSLKPFQNAIETFERAKKSIGSLTRKRIEMISQNSLENKIVFDEQDRIQILKGRAGTGKTVGLIQAAINLVDEYGDRVVILTYNKALVSDLRRLFALAELPDMFHECCVYVATMHSYFYKIINLVMYDGKLSGEKFLDEYDELLEELIGFMKEDGAIEIVKDIVSSHADLDWDYALIDEAQDWSNSEKEVILSIFDNQKVVVADGGLQFVRRLDACNWNSVKNKNNVKLSNCLRQKSNLISFLNTFTQSYYSLGGKIQGNDQLLGGKVHIVSQDNFYENIKIEMELLKENENEAYDMLFLTPHALCDKDEDNTFFSKKKEFEKHGIYIWDGTNADNRSEYTTRIDESRVLQYDSARGLEAWTVVCLEFDTFLEEKEKEYVLQDNGVDDLLLESPEEKKKKYMYNWAMIPFTRAIDTIVITMKNESSEMGKLLKKIANDKADYVYWG